MSLAPLLAAPIAIWIHAFAAIGALGVGLVLLLARKGTLPHRQLGWLWVLLMVAVSASAFFIHEIRLWGIWSAIHLLALGTLVALPTAIIAARRHDVRAHRRVMMQIFLGALIVAGAFSLLPGRIMHRVVLGGPAPQHAAGTQADQPVAR